MRVQAARSRFVRGLAGRLSLKGADLAEWIERDGGAHDRVGHASRTEEVRPGADAPLGPVPGELRRCVLAWRNGFDASFGTGYPPLDQDA